VTDYVLVTNPAGGYRNLDDIKKATRVVRYGTTGVGTGAQIPLPLVRHFVKARRAGREQHESAGTPEQLKV
jgi:hypothetical protein